MADTAPPPPVPPQAKGSTPPPGPGERKESPTVDESYAELAAMRQGSFLQQKWVQDYLPLATSIALHIGLALLIWATYEGVKRVYEVVKEQIIIPDAVIVDGQSPGGIPNPGLGGDPHRAAAQAEFTDVPPDSKAWADKPSESLNTSLMGAAGDVADSSLIGLGAGGSTGRGGDVSDRGFGGGGEGGGPLAPFGVPGGGGGAGPAAPFYGMGGNATKIAYVCDSSGSMMNKFDDLRLELQKAVEILQPIQAFSIIFFSEDKYLATGNELMMANPAHKRSAYEFLETVAAHGTSDPLPGLRLAFQQQPQLIYLLTDGEFPDNEAVIREIEKLNADKKVKINTIAFMNRGEDYEAVLKQIAKDNNGSFKYVGGADLGR